MPISECGHFIRIIKRGEKRGRMFELQTIDYIGVLLPARVRKFSKMG